MKTNINSRINSDQNLVLASWNINGGIQNVSDVEQLRADIFKKKIDVACLQETYKDENISKSEKKVILFFSEEMRNQIIEIMDKHSMSHKNGGKIFYM